MSETKPEVLKPQPKQESFLRSKADIVIFGGAAGGGKTLALLLEPLRHVHRRGFSTVIFRRTYPEVMAPGGLWPESMNIYPRSPLNGTPNKTELLWRFPHGSVIKFGHLQHEMDRLKWGGSQITMIGFDQLETFEAEQFWFMMSRNRSVCGVRPYIRATANPRPGWLADFIGWWIDQDSGYPIAERAGKLRWLTRIGDKLTWHDKEVDGAKSVTFIPAKLTDNRILMSRDPGYLSSLQAMPHIDRERLEKGNWKIFDIGSEWPPEYFSGGIWFDDWPDMPCLRVMALDPSQGRTDTSDYSAWVMLTRTPDGTWWCEANLARRPVSKIISDGLFLAEQFHPEMAACETNAFQNLIAVELGRRNAGYLPMLGINNHVEKDVRIRRIGPVLGDGKIKFRRTIGTQILVDQLKMFPQGDHDDGPDALEMAMRLWVHMMKGRRAQVEGIHVVTA